MTDGHFQPSQLSSFMRRQPLGQHGSLHFSMPQHPHCSQNFTTTNNIIRLKNVHTSE
ncbi:hypothetical protein V6Z11_D10G084400 [Gossypium hirsutum]